MSIGLKDKKKILFLCTGNSCRSQMAEGWARHLKNDSIKAYSAGIEKHGLNQMAVQAMLEAGVDISSHRSTTIDELPVIEFDWIITLCGHAKETCPFFPGNRFHIGFDDPPKLAASVKTEEEKFEQYKKVRDAIRDFVEGLPDNLIK